MSGTVEHGKTGFRCRTFGEFVQAVTDIENPDPHYTGSAIDNYRCR